MSSKTGNVCYLHQLNLQKYIQMRVKGYPLEIPTCRNVCEIKYSLLSH